MLTSNVGFQAFLASALLYLFPLQITSTHAAGEYTLADLEVLRDGKNYQEFFEHAKDVVPTKRDKHWQDMLSNMTSDYVDDLRRKKIFTQKAFQNVERLASWPEQRRDEFFQVKRQSFALEYFKTCLSSMTGETPAPSKSDCEKQMQSFWQNSRKEVETAYQLLLLRVGFFPGKKTWSYLRPIVSSELSNIYCERPMVKEAFLSHLHEIDWENENAAALKVKVQRLANESCWKAIYPSLKATLTELPPTEGHTFFKMATVLEILDPEEIDTWLVRYYLESPQPGDTLNLAWNTLNKLSQDYDRRMKVLQKLLTQDPLPGAIFSLRNKERRRILTVNFSEQFPEYVQRYAKVCMNYLTGEQTFPQGNPTKDCHNLIDTDRNLKQKNLISDEIHVKYSAIEKRVGR